MMNKRLICLIMMILTMVISSSAFAAITQQQGDDMAEFAKKFIEVGNSRRDENGFPLLTYALTGSWNGNVKLRTAGYNEQLYYIKGNGYYYSGGRYLELGNKWCMDCGTCAAYLIKKTLGVELLTYENEPWHVNDVYRDACKGADSQYFEFVYKSVSVGNIDYSKLQKGDYIALMTGHGNHAMLYVGDGMIVHANSDMIRSYGNNKISGFAVSKLNQYLLWSTPVRVMRLKDGIVPEDRVVNSKITWPDNGETMDLLGREEVQAAEDEKTMSGEEITLALQTGSNKESLIKLFSKLQDNIKPIYNANIQANNLIATIDLQQSNLTENSSNSSVLEVINSNV